MPIRGVAREKLADWQRCSGMTISGVARDELADWLAEEFRYNHQGCSQGRAGRLAGRGVQV